MKRIHMLLSRWNQPPCRNMELKRVIRLRGWASESWAGTTPKVAMT
jgi:hypothetical protein